MDYIKDVGEYNFSVIQGVSETHSLFNWQVNGMPFTLSDAQEVRADFREDPHYSGSPDLSLNLQNGGITVQANNAYMHFGINTLQLRQGVYHYDVLVVKAGKRYMYVRGQMMLTGVVTR